MQRCKAKSKRSGKRCKNFAIKGWGVCRIHGANGGPKTVQGKQKCKNASFKHGWYSSEAIQERKLISKALKINQKKHPQKLP